MFSEKYVSNRQLCEKLLLSINEYDKIFPPVGELKVPPTLNQAEIYITACWMYNQLDKHREYYLNPRMFFIQSREELKHISSKNIITLMNFLLDS